MDIQWYRPNDLVLNLHRHEVSDPNEFMGTAYSEVADLQKGHGGSNSTEIEKLFRHSKIHSSTREWVKEMIETVGFYHHKKHVGEVYIYALVKDGF